VSNHSINQTEDALVYLSPTTLARKLNMSIPTMNDRIRARGVKPDACVIHGNSQSTLWAMDRLPELRAILQNNQS
jgi:hypothetical protein